MKIAAADLALSADHTALTHDQRNETLRAWRGERPNFEAMENADRQARPLPSAITNISSAARAAAAAPPAPSLEAGSAAQSVDAMNEAVDNDPFILLIRRMLEMLTGEEVRVFDMQRFAAELHHTEMQANTATAAVQPAGSGRAGWGMEYDAHAVHEEQETTRFSASGTIRTADGQEISFSLDLEMQRTYREETSVSVRAGDAVRKDPLVVNFDGTATQLSALADQRFRFDLDGDGHAESLPLFASGSGYLALDRNGNGKIDSGKELFGPATGQGFGELARLDEDGNGWIDENDTAFDQLSVWTPAAEGAGTLRSLADLGIGALALAHTATPFALRGDQNADLGGVKVSGLYLTETGKPGNLQEIDLAA